jgi:hypothetical protein
MQNRDSSEKTTWYHSCIQFCRWAHYCPPRVSVLQCQGKPQQWSPRKQSVLLQTSSHCPCGYFRAANNSISRLTVRNVAVRFCKADLPVLSGVRSRMPFRSFTVFRMILHNTSISYSHDNLLIPNNVSSNIVER